MKIEKMQKIAITIFPIILCLYFFGVFISNIVSLSPALSAFFTAGTSKFVWRAIIALIYGAYIVFVVIVFKIKFNQQLLLISALVLFIVLISPLFNLAPLTAQYYDQWNRLVAVQINVGFVEIVSYYGDAFFSFLFLFSLLFVLPTLFKKSNLPFIVFYFLIFIMIIACLFSYATEFSQYLHPLESAYGNNIDSFFLSKNAFGSFLYQSVLISVYMVFVGGINFKKKFTGKAKIIWTIGWSFAAFVFFVTLVFTMNKNSIGSALLFLILLPLFLLYKKAMPQKHKMILLGSYAGASLFLLILVLAVPSLNSLVGSLFNSADGRNELVRLFFLNLRGSQVFVGFGHAFYLRLYLWSSSFGNYIIVNNVHNAFFTVLGEGGILYLFFYIGLIIYNFYILFKQRKNNISTLIAIAILISFIFGSFFESTQLYVSGSSGSILISILVISIPLSFDDKAKFNPVETIPSEVNYETQ